MGFMTFALGGLIVWMPTFLHRAGYTLLLPDFQAHGESDAE